MNKLHRSIVDHAQKLLRARLEELVAKKIGEAGVSVTPDVVKGLTDHILSRKGGEFVWGDEGENDSPTKKIAISFTDEDLNELDRANDALLKAIPNTIERLSIEAGGDIFKGFKEWWPAKAAFDGAEHFNFQQRLDARWGTAFDYLRMLRAFALQLGEDAFQRHRRSKGKGPALTRDVLLRLHARACQITGEIITLMENGYADGAMARWRTLHEIVVVALVISDSGEDVARRYVDHEAVEAKKALKVHEDHLAITGAKPFARRTRDKIIRDYEAAKKKYGKDFKHDYGWAAHLVNPPTFDQLEKLAKRAASRSSYKLASYNVHAGVKGIAFRLGLLGNPGFLTGPSNAGFEEPGANAAYALTQLSVLIFGPRKSIEQIAAMRALLKFSDEATKAFFRAASVLLRDEKAERTRKVNASKRRPPKKPRRKSA